jgi:hypothetical protein
LGVSAIVDFLEGSGPDGAGRSVNEVLKFGLGALESRHDFIQWLFPISEPSTAVPGSPVLKPEDIAAIKASVRAQAALIAAQDKMIWFYDQTDHWLQAQNHNHLRITRIIKSLRLLVGDLPADHFRNMILARVERHNAAVGETPLMYWRAA